MLEQPWNAHVPPNTIEDPCNQEIVDLERRFAEKRRIVVGVLMPFKPFRYGIARHDESRETRCNTSITEADRVPICMQRVQK